MVSRLSHSDAVSEPNSDIEDETIGWPSVVDEAIAASNLDGAQGNKTDAHKLVATIMQFVTNSLGALHERFLERLLLFSNPHIEPLLSTIHTTLASSASNDSIANDLAELLGFENIELVTQILEKRSAVAESVPLSEHHGNFIWLTTIWTAQG